MKWGLYVYMYYNHPTLVVILFLVESTCQSGWTSPSFNDNCYRVYSDEEEWNDAESSCVRQGGQLASIHGARKTIGCGVCEYSLFL